jgi:NADH-quinone oxidoreductase subunit J|tara:strand:- start:795 stop:1313 length:519 start_codon:yes stop_codon:yes gene_type:complete
VELILFYLAAAISLGTTLMAITRTNAAHALIYFIISLLASAVIFFLVGAPFAAVLEVIVYAGAIMVLFVFVIMMLNLGEAGQRQEQAWLSLSAWIVPAILAAILLAEMVLVLSSSETPIPAQSVTPKQVGESLFGPYILAVEIASMLLLAGLVGAYHLGRRYLEETREDEGE